MNWHRTETNVVLEELNTDKERGLTSTEAGTRLSKHGPNELVEKGGRTPFQILWEQLTATMVLILIVAAVAAGALGDTKDAIAILAIVLLFAIAGIYPGISRRAGHCGAQKDGGADRSKSSGMDNLTELSARELVPGDIVQLETGNLDPGGFAPAGIGQPANSGSRADGRIRTSQQAHGRH